MNESENWVYTERLTSWRTPALFAGLAFLFGLLAWLTQGGARTLCLCLAAVFVFYTLNYWKLVIRVGPGALKLTFGVFSWTVALDNVTSCRLDEIPPFLRYGGAGIHFYFLNGRYRVSFNFLEYPRVMIALKRPAGWVREVSFSTRAPQAVLSAIQDEAAPQG